MSHVVMIELRVKDLDALEEAAKELGAVLVRDQKTYKWYGRWMNDFNGEDAAYRKVSPKDYGKCDHAVTHPKCQYEIGLIKQEDGAFLVIADEWGPGGLAPVFGKGMQKLKQRYGTAVAAKAMRRQGFMVKETADDKGNVRLVCTHAA